MTGVLCFSTLAEAVGAIETVSGNYAHHCQAARDYAKAHFDAMRICAELLE